MSERVSDVAARSVTSDGQEPYRFELLQSDAELAALEPEWIALFVRAQAKNPFAHPSWMIPWFRHFVPGRADRIVVAMRREDELVAVAPIYYRDYGVGSIRARALQLAGGSPRSNDRLTEMSEVLALPAERRKALRALVHHLALEVGGWDWLGITLSSGHGWFEGDWLPDAWRRRGAFAVHKAVRTFVVLPLPASWSELRLKRNLKEALRRSRNRLAALDVPSEISFVQGEALPDAVESLLRLHGRRAELSGRLSHDDNFQDPTTAGLVREAAQKWSRSGGATAAFLSLDGAPIAGRLLLDANRTHFLSFSGFEPEHWRLGASASLMAASIQRAIDLGGELVNFSVSPDSAKLRWSEQLDFQHEFVAVSPARRSRYLFSLWWQLSARRALTQTRRLLDGQLPSDRRDPSGSDWG
ncbi:MAG: GNAT family N-acetyltransferase [Gaiellaceae bacterium]